MIKAGKYACQCEPGWKGLNCDEEHDECQSSPCMNNATCTRQGDTFLCQCPDGFSGKRRASLFCSHWRPHIWASPWCSGTGKRCETNVDDCAPNPCRNNSTCVDQVGNYTCVCPPQLMGRHCEDAFDACATSPCQNGASCITTQPQQDFYCECVAGNPPHSLLILHNPPQFSIWIHSGPFWSLLVHSGPFWSILVHSGPFWSILIHSGSILYQFWSIWVQIGPFWSILIHLHLSVAIRIDYNSSIKMNERLNKQAAKKKKNPVEIALKRIWSNPDPTKISPYPPQSLSILPNLSWFVVIQSGPRPSAYICL